MRPIRVLSRVKGAGIPFIGDNSMTIMPGEAALAVKLEKDFYARDNDNSRSGQDSFHKNSANEPTSFDSYW
jgi:hypothetical protein